MVCELMTIYHSMEITIYGTVPWRMDSFYEQFNLLVYVWLVNYLHLTL